MVVKCGRGTFAYSLYVYILDGCRVRASLPLVGEVPKPSLPHLEGIGLWISTVTGHHNPTCHGVQHHLFYRILSNYSAKTNNLRHDV